MSVEREQIGACTLYRGDCREVVPTLGAVDAVITDPPYGVNLAYATYDDTSIHYREQQTQWLAAMRAVTHGPLAISCGIANVCHWPQPDWMLCWYKPAAMGRCALGFNNWEPVLLYGRGRGGQVVDVFTAPILPEKTLTGHPCPKPLAWGIHLVTRLTQRADRVCDPFMGSGTTGVACVQLGRAFVGVEIDPRYFDLACQRITDAYAQPDLFVPMPTRPQQQALFTGGHAHA